MLSPFFYGETFFIARDSMEFSLTVGERLSSIIIIFLIFPSVIQTPMDVGDKGGAVGSI
jgi:hypothetical protein